MIVVLLLVVAVALLALAQPTWLTVTGPAATGEVTLTGAGTQVAPLVTAAAVVLAAAAIASTIAGRWARVIVLVLAALGGVGAAIACGLLLADPLAAGSDVLSDSTGVRTRASEVSLSWAPAAALVASVIGSGAALLGLWARPPRASARFEQPGDSTEDDPAGAWDALSRGDDPTD